MLKSKLAHRMLPCILSLAVFCAALLAASSRVAVFAAPGDSASGIEFTELGTDAPPAELNGYALHTMGDGFGDGATTSVIPSVLGDITASIGAGVLSVGADLGWKTWSHGFTGHVYYFNSAGVTLTMPSFVKSFVFYAEPSSHKDYEISVEVNGEDSAVYTQEINGNSGAKGFAFTATGGNYISSVSIRAPGEAGGFAIGEIAVGAFSQVLPAQIEKQYTGADLTAEFIAALEELYPGAEVDLTASQNGTETPLVEVGVYDASVTFTIGDFSETILFENALKIFKKSTAPIDGIVTVRTDTQETVETAAEGPAQYIPIPDTGDKGGLPGAFTALICAFGALGAMAKRKKGARGK